MFLVSYLKKSIPVSSKIQIDRILSEFKRVLKRKKTIVSKYEIIEISHKKMHVFFGYYDISPFNKDDDFVYLNTRGEGEANICLNNITNLQERIVTTTRLWNWQQGCRLRWLPNSNSKIIFNDLVNDRYVSRIVDVNTKEEQMVNFPLYDLASDGKKGLSINFSLLGQKRPAYGYTEIPYIINNKSTDDGIFLVDLEKNESNLILTFQEILIELGLNISEVDNCYLNHLSFSPDNSKFLFFLLREKKPFDDAFLLVYDFTNNKLSVIENHRKVSHYTWLGNDKIICTSINNDRSNMDPQYIEYSLDNNKKRVLAPNILNKDGHPTMLSEKLMITDTYALSDAYQRLFLANINKGTHEVLAEIFHVNISKSDGIEKRTDLHPRVNLSKNIVCFDMNTTGHRSLGLVKL